MTLLDVLCEYENKLKSNDVNDMYAALGFALQLPGICGRLEFKPDDMNIKSGNVKDDKALYKKDKNSPSGFSVFDKNMFCHWFSSNKTSFSCLFSPYNSFVDIVKSLYELRNAFTHNGIVKTVCDNVILIDDKNANGMVTGQFLFLPVHRFCEAVFREARYLFERLEDSDSKAIEVSPFYGCGMDASTYQDFMKFAESEFSAFWDAHSKEDHKLNLFYEHVFLCCESGLDGVRKWFDEHPGDKYEAIVKVGGPDNEIFFEKECCGCGGMPCRKIVGRLDKCQFERMLVVKDELAACSAIVNSKIAEMLHCCD